MVGTAGKLVRLMRAAGQVTALNDSDAEEEILRTILGFPVDSASPEDIVGLFGEHYFPGTFAIGEIRQDPGFLCGETRIGYEPWVRREIRRDIETMRPVLRLNADVAEASRIEDDVLELLDHKLKDGRSLRDVIVLQEYTDVFRRLILCLLTGNPELEVNTYAQLDAIGGAAALAVVDELNDRPLAEVLKTSLAAGLVGLNLKTSASATSRIHESSIIRIDPHRDAYEQKTCVLDGLRRKASERMEIDYWEEYEEQVLGARPTTLVVFTDDYIETVFDLKLIERELSCSPKLTVWLIPRARRYGNDASYDDVMRLLGHPALRILKSLRDRGRLDVCPNGPRLGTVNGLKISQDAADLLKRCDLVLVKGARSYEMLQGIGKPTYYGFAVCRELSEAVTGIDAEKGSLVFIRQRPYERTFAGFRNRQMRPKEFRPKQSSFLCRVTAKDCYEEDSLRPFYNDLCERGRRALQHRSVQVLPFLDDMDRDSRRGLTLIARPSLEISQRLLTAMERIRRIAPEHFYYDGSRFHFTILSLATAREGFELQSEASDLYRRTIQEVTDAFPPFEVEFRGAGATENSIIAKGFPIGGVLEAMRSVLRDRLSAAGLGRGVDERYRSRGAHVTLARFRKVDDYTPLARSIDELGDACLGHMRVGEVQLVVNDFYMSPSKIRRVADMELTGRNEAFPPADRRP